MSPVDAAASLMASSGEHGSGSRAAKSDAPSDPFDAVLSTAGAPVANAPVPATHRPEVADHPAAHASDGPRTSSAPHSPSDASHRSVATSTAATSRAATSSAAGRDDATDAGTTPLSVRTDPTPGGTALPPGSTTLRPAGVDPVPGDPTLRPGGTDPTSGGTTLLPGGIDPTPGGPSLLPGSTDPTSGGPSLLPGGIDPTPGDPSLLPAGVDPVPGDPTLRPGGTDPTSGGTSLLPGGIDPVPGGPSLLPGGVDPTPGGPSLLPSGVDPAPGGPSLLPGGIDPTPGGPSLMPGGTWGRSGDDGAHGLGSASGAPGAASTDPSLALLLRGADTGSSAAEITSADATGAGTGDGSAPGTGEQLVAVLEPLRTGPDGVHELTLALEPEGLGTVKATVAVGPQQVTVRLAAETSHGEAAIRQALPDLREHLGQGRGRPATVVLAENGAGRDGIERGGSWTSDDQPTSAMTAPDAVAGRTGAGAAPTGGGRIVDLRL